MLVKTTQLTVCSGDSWTLYKGGRGNRNSMPPNEVNSEIAMVLIENDVNEMKTRACRTSDVEKLED